MNCRWTAPLVLAPILVAALASSAAGQNYDLDARNVGMGAIGSTRNIASQFVMERRKYLRIGLPIGLFQVVSNSDVFRYGNNAFDLFRSMEYARNPFHYTFGRDDSNTGKKIADDILDGNLNRNLNAYRVFQPAPKYVAEGVGFPNWGYTFKVRRSKEKDKKTRDDEGYQGIYVGAGPYLTVTTDTRVNQPLINLLGSPVPTFLPNAALGITHATTGQVAAAIIGGYRLYVPHHGSGLRQEGLYFAVNVADLIGLRLGDLGTAIRFDTDAAGLLALAPTTVPIEVNWQLSRKGHGRVVDVGVAVTLEHWDFGVGINGIGNQITWEQVTRRRFQLQSYFNGSEIDEVPSPPVTQPLRVEVPLNSSANVAYTANRWSVAAEYSRRFEGNNIQSGFEYRSRGLDIRAGLRYARDRWHPSGGVGLNLTPRLGIDVAIFSTSTNVERRRTAALAFSFRIESKPKDGEPARH